MLFLSFSLVPPSWGQKSQAPAEKRNCIIRALQGIAHAKDESLLYFQAVRKEGPRRAVIRNREESEIPYPRRWQIGKQVTRRLEDLLVGPKRTFTVPVKLLIGQAGFIVLAKGQTAFVRHEDNLTLQEVASDYRYAVIHKELAERKISQQIAIKDARQIRASITAFDRMILDPKIRRELQDKPVAVFLKLRTDPKTAPLFEPLDHMINGDVDKLALANKGYRFAPGAASLPSPTNNQIISVYALRIQELQVFPRIREWFGISQKSSLNFSGDPASKAIYESIRNSPFRRKLETLLTSHGIDEKQYMYALMQDYARQILFKQYQILGVLPLRAGNQGSPLTIEGARDESLRLLATGSN